MCPSCVCPEQQSERASESNLGTPIVCLPYLTLLLSPSSRPLPCHHTLVVSYFHRYFSCRMCSQSWSFIVAPLCFGPFVLFLAHSRLAVLWWCVSTILTPRARPHLPAYPSCASAGFRSCITDKITCEMTHDDTASMPSRTSLTDTPKVPFIS